MDFQPLNLTNSCSICGEKDRRWQLSLVIPSSHPAGKNLPQRKPQADYAILFCPVCDKITPQDLDPTDPRTMTIPPEADPENADRTFAEVVFSGAERYRSALAPGPYRKPGSFTMKRRYDNNGREVTGP
jgi:hypothetical protein